MLRLQELPNTLPANREPTPGLEPGTPSLRVNDAIRADSSNCRRNGLIRRSRVPRYSVQLRRSPGMCSNGVPTRPPPALDTRSSACSGSAVPDGLVASSWHARTCFVLTGIHSTCRTSVRAARPARTAGTRRRTQATSPRTISKGRAADATETSAALFHSDRRGADRVSAPHAVRRQRS